MPINECTLIDLPHIRDARGSLSFVEGGRHVPFDIRRVYYLYDVTPGVSRGAHAHKKLEQLLIPLGGAFDVVLDDGRAQKTIRLEHSDVGLYICPMIWRELLNFSSGAVCFVLASAPYDEEDYFRNHEEFLAAVRRVHSARA